MHYLLKWIKFSVKKNKTLKKYWKNGKRYWKSQGILSVQKSGNPGVIMINTLFLTGYQVLHTELERNFYDGFCRLPESNVAFTFAFGRCK